MKNIDNHYVWVEIPALVNQGVHSSYINIITQYITGEHQPSDHKDSNNIDRGVRHGDNVSPKLFNAALEGIFRMSDWDRNGSNINDDHLSHLHFASDVVLITNNAE